MIRPPTANAKLVQRHNRKKISFMSSLSSSLNECHLWVWGLDSMSSTLTPSIAATCGKMEISGQANPVSHS